MQAHAKEQGNGEETGPGEHESQQLLGPQEQLPQRTRRPPADERAGKEQDV